MPLSSSLNIPRKHFLSSEFLKSQHLCKRIYLIDISKLYIFFILLYFLTLQYCIGFAIYQHESATGIHVFPILNPPPSPYHPSGSFQCTSPKHPISCIDFQLEVNTKVYPFKILPFLREIFSCIERFFQTFNFFFNLQKLAHVLMLVNTYLKKNPFTSLTNLCNRRC